jgi:hypothetical protein
MEIAPVWALKMPCSPREFTGPIQLAAIDAQTSQLKTLAFAA